MNDVPAVIVLPAAGDAIDMRCASAEAARMGRRKKDFIVSE